MPSSRWHYRYRATALDTVEKFNALPVPLRTAIHFIANIHQEQERAFPDIRCSSIDSSITPLIDHDLTCSETADTWASQLLRKAQKMGYDNVSLVRDAILRMNSMEQGERPISVMKDLLLGSVGYLESLMECGN